MEADPAHVPTARLFVRGQPRGTLLTAFRTPERLVSFAVTGFYAVLVICNRTRPSEAQRFCFSEGLVHRIVYIAPAFVVVRCRWLT